jgi:archaellum biogenesis protein FlaJ (TadC family)
MGNVEKWLAVISVALFAMFAGEMISVYYFMLTVPEDAVVAQGFTPDPKLIQFVSIGVAPAGILAAVAYIMSRNYGSKQIGGSVPDIYVTDAVQYLPLLFIILSAPVMAVGARLILKRKKRPTKEYF